MPVANWGILGGGGAKYFLRGRNVHQGMPCESIVVTMPPVQARKTGT